VARRSCFNFLSVDCRRHRPYVLRAMSRVYALAAEVRKADSPVARFMRRTFPNVSSATQEWHERLEGLPTVRPREGKRPIPYGTLGAALDYRLRYYFRESIVETSQAQPEKLNLDKTNPKWI
jgi:hypothetical protein